MMAFAAKKRAMRIGPGLAAELASIKYPICYMDFESLWPALPWFAGMRPYDHIPFQWSLHRREHAGAPLTHTEFLWDNPIMLHSHSARFNVEVLNESVGIKPRRVGSKYLLDWYQGKGAPFNQSGENGKQGVIPE
jgi:hypothetical protein